MNNETPTIHSVAAVANYVLRNIGSDVTQLKLQKLLYYVQGYSLVVLQKPMFKEDLEAWDYGPVIPELYEQLKKYKDNPITGRLEAVDLISPESQDAKLIDAVLNLLKEFSAGQLVTMTHRHDSPWDIIWQGGAGKFSRIPSWLLIRHFAQLVGNK